MSSPVEDTARSGVPVTVSVVILSVAAFASSMCLRAADPILPAVGDAFGVTTGSASVIVTIFAVAYGLVQFVVGGLGDRVGKLRVIGYACAASVVGALLCAAAGGLTALTIARGLAGLSAGAIIPLAMAWIGDAVPFERRQPVLARFLTGQVFGLVFGQAIGGWAVDAFGWRAVFLIMAVVFTPATLAVAWADRAQRRAASADRARPAATRPPVAEVLRLPKVRLILSVVFVEALAMYVSFPFVAADLHQRGGWSLAQAGLAAGAFGLGGLVYILAVGQIVGRFGRTHLPMIGAGIQLVGFGLLALPPSWVSAVAGLVLVGIGFYALHNTLQTEATQMLPSARGFAVSLFAAIFFCGQAIGAALGGVVHDAATSVPAFLATAVAIPLVAIWMTRGLARVRVSPTAETQA